ncbi:NAD(P)-binding protein [Bradyrhizobium guangdongense]|uniref:NAD(P)-binding protein n=1 Tax=Bradyrhizobium guangdongense TaxID=1325090 RepID=UPI001319EC38|nr:NAD(P)-binding protein [Bradyrhizobium guangdongense]
MSEYPADAVDRARLVEQSYLISDGVYVLGSLERGVTVYKQQVRAHNLLWALGEINRGKRAKRVAIIGAGIAGLTAAAAALVVLDSAKVTLFERRWDYCPLQSGSDNRWLHPRIYDWPVEGSRAPSASLPILNWSEGRASDVVKQITARFGAIGTANADRLRIFVGVNHLKVTSATRAIEWIGTSAKAKAGALELSDSEGSFEDFDIVILASGFGLERRHPIYGSNSYWRNDQRGQPILDGSRQTVIVSGYGDGALVDICRLTIARFRQDSIVYDLFGSRNIEGREAEIRAIKSQIETSGLSKVDAFESMIQFIPDVGLIRSRIRRDTNVIAHLSGLSEKNTSIADAIGNGASFLNQFLFYLLYRSGAFSISFDCLEAVASEFDVQDPNVICRHGADTMKHLLSFFSDPARVEMRLNLLRSDQRQVTGRHWVPGCFPLH